MNQNERKLVCMLIGCKNLPPLVATGTNNSYVSLRVVEHYTTSQQVVEAGEKKTVVEHHNDPVDEQKMQSRTRRLNSNPEFIETFVFGNLPIPLLRKSSVPLLNNSSLGGSEPPKRRPTPFGFLADSALPHLEPSFHLRAEVFDNTAVGEGVGDKIAQGEIPLGTLVQGQRATVSHKLHLVPCDATGVTEAAAASAEDQEEGGGRLPELSLILEPINFGVVKSSREEEEPFEDALRRALDEELGDVFCSEFISKVHSIIFSGYTEGVVFNRPVMVSVIEELYLFTGVEVLTHADLMKEVQFLYKLFDKDNSDTLDVSEICGLIRGSSLTGKLKQKWKARPWEKKKRKSGVPSSSASAGGQVVGVSTVAGALWLREVPPPYKYQGYRRADGSVHPKSRRPPAPRDCPRFKPKTDTINEFDQQYATSPTYAPVAPPEPVAIEETEEEREERIRQRGDDTDPPFVAEYIRQRDEMFKGFAPRVTVGGGVEEEPPPPPISTYIASDRKLNFAAVFSERLSGHLIEEPPLELFHCTLANCYIAGCLVTGGTLVDCVLESCVVVDGADIRSATFLRCCRIEHSRVQQSHPVNCRIEECVLHECPHVMQCSLLGVELSSSSVVHCHLLKCSLDPLVVDDGANLFEKCELDKPMSQRTAALLKKTTLEEEGEEGGEEGEEGDEKIEVEEKGVVEQQVQEEEEPAAATTATTATSNGAEESATTAAAATEEEKPETGE